MISLYASLEEKVPVGIKKWEITSLGNEYDAYSVFTNQNQSLGFSLFEL